MKKQDPVKKDKQEKLTPEQIWKNASLILGSKKKDGMHSTENLQKSVDFTDIKNRLQEITEQKIESLNIPDARENFYKNELKNSLFHIPDFNSVDSTYKLIKTCDTPQYFPKNPLNIFDSPEIYKNLEIDTLFFIFYKNPNTVHQYHAATQLKLCSWRFHTKYLTWFQRLEEPKLITSDYERGDFLFFDYDVTWNFMKKSDFTFEYKYLECAEL